MAFSHSSRPSLAEASPIKKRPGTWRPLWRKIHLYLGFGSGLVLLVLALSGITLIFSDDLDRLLHPDFYATTGAEAALTPDVYLAAATAVVPEGAATQLRWPRTTGAPVTVLVRAEPKHRATDQGADHTATKKDMDAAPSGERRNEARQFLVFLDPPTARVLGTVNYRERFAAIVLSLHRSLLVPQWFGADIVGFSGIGLAILCVTGLVLWWPRGPFLKGLYFHRGRYLRTNLHYTTGFWVLAPLTIMVVTGLTLSYPRQARGLVNVFAELSPRPPERPGRDALLLAPHLDPAEILDRALAQIRQEAPETLLRPVSLTWPSMSGKVWRVQLDLGQEESTLLIDDATGEVARAPETLSGEALLLFLRRLHGATHHGLVWEGLALLAGLGIPLLLVTGILMWLRRRPHAVENLPATAVCLPESEQSAA